MKMIPSKYLVATIFLVSLIQVQAQDIHMSQFFTSPLALNPAAAGVTHTDIRVMSNYKMQWGSIGDKYRTVFASVDAPIKIKKDPNSFFGVGVSVISDKAGKSRMGLTQISLPVSFTVRTGEWSALTAGFQAAWAQHSINTGGLSWDSQYNGNAYDPSLPTGEGGGGGNFSHFDYSAGLLWSLTPAPGMKMRTGLSVSHLTRPNQSYLGGGDPLKMRYTIHWGSSIHLRNPEYWILPYLLTMRQGNAYEISGGAMLKHQIGIDSRFTNNETASFISIGGLYRYKDAIIASLWYEYKRAVAAGISYDINVSKLTQASKGFGGLEFSLIYMGFFKPEHRIRKISEIIY